MRMVGTTARGIRMPIITRGDNLGDLVVENVLEAAKNENFSFKDKDIIGITEAVVAKAEGNYASVSDIAADVKEKFGDHPVGLVFPILSRNRFLNILKGISQGVSKLYILLKLPCDEVGNPIMDTENTDFEDLNGLYNEAEFRKINQNFIHPFTGIDYISLYKNAGDNIEIYFSNNPKDILKLTPYVIDAEIHLRFQTQKKLLKAGAQKVHLLSDILSTPSTTRGYNEHYGVLGSNISTEEQLKLFPRSSQSLVDYVQKELKAKTGAHLEVLVYGDGAFKDPYAGIWELADPVVSPAFTEGLAGTPNEIKLKYIADNQFGHLSSEEKKKAITEFIQAKSKEENNFSEGTTPRRYADLLGSLCDLVSGSGDKGTPVVFIQGYFDDYSIES